MSYQKENGTGQSAVSNVVMFPHNDSYYSTIPNWNEPKSLIEALHTCLFWQKALSDLETEFIMLLASIPHEQGRKQAVSDYKSEIRIMLNKCRKYAGGQK